MTAAVLVLVSCIYRCQRYAIDAYARISGVDLRPRPFRNEDVPRVRQRYLARFGK